LTYRVVKARESSFLLALHYDDFDELLDIRPSPGSLYLYSRTEPFNEEMDLDYGKTRAWLERFRFSVRAVHCSGHASRSDLFEIIEEIEAKKVMPTHTEHHEIFSVSARSARPRHAHQGDIVQRKRRLIGLKRRTLGAEEQLKDFRPESLVTREAITKFYGRFLITLP
jgi:hypothetical protein